jgi:hypothetical protein
VTDEVEKQRAEHVAYAVANVSLVVNNLHVVGGAEAAASPPSDPAAAAGPPALRGVRLELETGTPAWTRYAGYDSSGQRVATVYTVTTADLAGRGNPDLAAEGRAVDHVAIYRKSDTQSYLVLWHIPRDDDGYTP